MIVEDDALQRPGIVRVVGVLRRDLKLQGAAGGDLDPLEAHHLQAVRVLRDLVTAEIPIHHCREHEFVLLVCGHHRSVLFVHSCSSCQI